VQLPFRGDVSPLPPDAEGSALLILPRYRTITRETGPRQHPRTSPRTVAGSQHRPVGIRASGRGSAAKGKNSPKRFPNPHRLTDRRLQTSRNASGRHSAHWPIEEPSGAFGPSMNFPTTERIASITIKSAESMAAIASAGTHLVPQGTNRIKGT